VTQATKGICCAAGVCGVACCPCGPCVAGAVGCSAVSAECLDCIKKQQLEKQNKSPNYDPPGKSIVMDRSNNGENNHRIDRQYIIDYIRRGLTYDISDDDIISNFRNIVPLDNYNETYATFVAFDKGGVDAKIRGLNTRYKKKVGGKKTRKYSKQKTTRKRRKAFLKNKKKRKTKKYILQK